MHLRASSAGFDAFMRLGHSIVHEWFEAAMIGAPTI